jgi:hypothetical protein
VRPILVLNPRGDEEFVALVERLAADDPSTPQELQDALRETYPRAVVRPRSLSGEWRAVWYVYRDGRWEG